MLPFHNGDLDAARRLIGWIRVLGKVDTTCVLLRDARMKDDGGMKLLTKQAFTSVEELRPPHALPDERWPVGANWMFETALKHMADRGAFLWLEPDCGIKDDPTWFSQIDAAYRSSSKLFMGTIVHAKDSKLTEKHLNGIAVYPARAIDFFRGIDQRRHIAWDITTGPAILNETQDTPLIQHYWGEPNLPPTFVPFRGMDDPKNALTLDFIKPEAVIFHRVKDDSLLKLLRERHLARRVRMPINHTSTLGPTRTIWHVVQRYAQRDANGERRVSFAFDTWSRLYRPDFRPVHVWEFPRDSRDIGDNRALPYLKDVLDVALRQAGPDDAIMFTNDDTVMHPDVIPAIRERLGKQPTFCSFRVNYFKGQTPNLKSPVATSGRPSGPAIDDDIGRDLFVFTVAWLRQYWDSIPDFILGELEWDLILALMIRKHYGLPASGKTIGKLQPACELPKGYVWHERHDRAWIKADFYAPAKQHNWRLSAEWCKANNVEYPFE